MSKMKLKSPLEVLFFDGNALNGIQILDKFQEVVLHQSKQKLAKELWNLLSQYLDSQENHELFVSWSKIRLNQGTENFIESVLKIRDRMNKHLIV